MGERGLCVGILLDEQSDSSSPLVCDTYWDCAGAERLARVGCCQSVV